MNQMWKRIGVIALAGFVLATVAACGGLQQAAQKNKNNKTLKEIGLMYHAYHDMYNKGPSGMQDLQQLASQYPDGYAGLQSGQFVLIYGGKLQEMIQGTSNTVLGYEAAVPNSGGLVIMADGAVRQMTAQEFANAPKAQPKKP
jgi:hypothetical protein